MEYLWCCGIGAVNLESIARWRGIRQPKVPELKIERKCFVILNSNLSEF